MPELSIHGICQTRATWGLRKLGQGSNGTSERRSLEALEMKYTLHQVKVQTFHSLLIGCNRGFSGEEFGDYICRSGVRSRTSRALQTPGRE